MCEIVTNSLLLTLKNFLHSSDVLFADFEYFFEVITGEESLLITTSLGIHGTHSIVLRKTKGCVDHEVYDFDHKTSRLGIKHPNH